MKKAVIFDMDGTLANVSSFLHLLEEPDRDYHGFHLATVDAPPHDHVVDAACDAVYAGFHILIVTARIATYMPETLTWLGKNGVPFDRLYMRAVGDFREDRVVKSEIYDRIVDDGFDVQHAWEDNPHVVALWQELGIPVTIMESLY